MSYLNEKEKNNIIKIDDKLLSFPKIEEIDFVFEKEDMTEWLNNMTNGIS
ncbi:hypothetical protein [Oceanirhabdus seepicola]|uniref:Uncharacterized protein n=1 Tax=Oceanirhabdus seepicola TaxID=2828781 RepID=A0A9J6NZ00_9CLOT|nr:hypothetical protein [Oceanirhabdus seepicola]MCM1989206.1 hypothetical protein [Oceanirhabdus seepicola]